MEEFLDKIDGKDERPIREIVLDNLRKAIFNNKLKPGDRLVETTIAEAMGISRTPVREALRQLELEGLATNAPRKGTVVNGISMKDALEMYDVREVLEGLAARLTCNNISRKNINILKEIINNMEECIKTHRLEDLFEMNNQWNDMLMLQCQNKVLIQDMKELHDHLRRFRLLTLYDEELQNEAVEEYKVILKAIEIGDDKKVEEYAREHVRRAKQRFIKVFNKKSDKMSCVIENGENNI
ncbi:MAG: GntR family transcriptional regulator [Clostridium argentinense]|uniref:GntR family transcriptional regulator n=1 Tax=Clostridium faecium TaxID=2762223 RepID=A0ABR8YUT8_9CLOT|nr:MULTISPECIES: GntR family transcriptional regulator [Clostridium]MBD8047907.1 GntR family transcriptional regulator [Clostridium faecium]MBS5822509.1 GntR family transcriptional regulator [Clostridium argentinense]MDU1347948.1 GntR family transcriptional regulator [Clostridium argentinense]